MASFRQAGTERNLPRNIRPQIAAGCAEPPVGDGYLHEPKHDGHRLIIITACDGTLKLVSRNGVDRTVLFRAPFLELTVAGRCGAGWRDMRSDDHGVTHIDALNDAIGRRRSDRSAYFAFDPAVPRPP